MGTCPVGKEVCEEWRERPPEAAEDESMKKRVRSGGASSFLGSPGHGRKCPMATATIHDRHL